MSELACGAVGRVPGPAVARAVEVPDIEGGVVAVHELTVPDAHRPSVRHEEHVRTADHCRAGTADRQIV